MSDRPHMTADEIRTCRWSRPDCILATAPAGPPPSAGVTGLVPCYVCTRPRSGAAAVREYRAARSAGLPGVPCKGTTHRCRHAEPLTCADGRARP